MKKILFILFLLLSFSIDIYSQDSLMVDTVKSVKIVKKKPVKKINKVSRELTEFIKQIEKSFILDKEARKLFKLIVVVPTNATKADLNELMAKIKPDSIIKGDRYQIKSMYNKKNKTEKKEKRSYLAYSVVAVLFLGIFWIFKNKWKRKREVKKIVKKTSDRKKDPSRLTMPNDKMKSIDLVWSNGAIILPTSLNQLADLIFYNYEKLKEDQVICPYCKKSMKMKNFAGHIKKNCNRVSPEQANGYLERINKLLS